MTEATDAQLAYLYYSLGYDGQPPETKDEASDLIDSILHGEPPTERQINYLRVLGHDGPEPESKKEASGLIRKLRREQEGNEA